MLFYKLNQRSTTNGSRINRHISEHFIDDFISELFTVEKKLRKISFIKSRRLDNIPNWVVRDISDCLAEPVCAIFNMSV